MHHLDGASEETAKIQVFTLFEPKKGSEHKVLIKANNINNSK